MLRERQTLPISSTPDPRDQAGLGSLRVSRTGRRRDGVTLIEMLAVMAVLVVVGLVAMPVVNSLGRTSSRQAAAGLVLASLDQARALAIAQSSTFYVVFADGSKEWPETLRSRCFAIFKEEYNPAAKTQDGQPPYNRFQIGNWTVLPDGISFKPYEASASARAQKSTGATGEAEVEVKSIYALDESKWENFYCQPIEKEIKLPFIKFTSIGSVDEPTDASLAAIRIFEGAVTVDGKARPTNNVGSMREELVRLALATGRAKREEPTSEKQATSAP